MQYSPGVMRRVASRMAAIVIALGATALPTRASAQTATLDDFKRADGVTGCVGIPYPDLSRKCQDTMVDQKEQCSDYSCQGDKVPSIKRLLDDADAKKKVVAEQERQLKDEEQKLSNAKADEKRPIEDRISDYKKKLAESQQAVKALEESAVGAKKETELRLAFGTKCLELRGKVMKLYEEAINRAKSDQGKSDTPAEIKAIIGRNMSRWEENYKAHQAEMSNVATAVTDVRK